MCLGQFVENEWLQLKITVEKALSHQALWELAFIIIAFDCPNYKGVWVFMCVYLVKKEVGWLRIIITATVIIVYRDHGNINFLGIIKCKIKQPGFPQKHNCCSISWIVLVEL